MNDPDNPPLAPAASLRPFAGGDPHHSAYIEGSGRRWTVYCSCGYVVASPTLVSAEFDMYEHKEGRLYDGFRRPFKGGPADWPV